MTDWDLLVAGRPSVDVMFSGLEAWPALGRDLLADGLGICAGTSFNTPAAAHRLGLRVAYVAMVGDDRWSRIVREEWEREGLPTDFLTIVDRSMPFVSVALNHDGDRGFVTYYGAEEPDDEELERLALEAIGTVSARHLHAYAGEEGAQLIRAARERGMSVSVDAWGGPWWDGGSSIDALLEGVDVVFANGDEALEMTGETDVRAAVDRLSQTGTTAVVKLAALGAIAGSGGRIVEAPAEPARLLDTTGAGDCFNAGFLRGWLAGCEVAACLSLGTICGARAVEAFGGYRGCPFEPELLEIAASRGIVLDPVRGGTT